MKHTIPVGVSNRHVHLTEEHIKILFGDENALTVLKDLSQPGQFAANEKIEIVGPKKSLVSRILGPARNASQVEVSVSDTFVLGVEAVVRNSGDIEGTPGVILRGPKGEVELDKGVIVAARHIHFHTSDAEAMGIKDKDIVKLRANTERPVTFENVLCRVHDEFALDCHLDMDEANAALIKNGDELELIK